METTLQSEATRDTTSSGVDAPGLGVAGHGDRQQSSAFGLLLLVLSFLLVFGGIAGLAVGLWSTSAAADTEIVVTDVCNASAQTGDVAGDAIAGCAGAAAGIASPGAAPVGVDNPSTWSSFVASMRLTVPFPQIVVGGVARVLG